MEEDADFFGARVDVFLLSKMGSSGNIPGCPYFADISGESVADPIISENSSFIVSVSEPGASLLDISSETITDPSITFTTICD